jgi:hypothetical protein
MQLSCLLQKDLSKDTCALEAEIDQLVRELYGLLMKE